MEECLHLTDRTWGVCSKMKHIGALILTVAMLSGTANGMALGRRHRHQHRRPVVSHDVTVTPSEAIEQRVWSEIDRGEAILDHLTPENLLASPWLVSAIVYHDGFLSHFPRDKSTADPSRRIVAHLTTLVTPAVKQQYIGLLRDHYEGLPAADDALVQPVNGFIDVRHLRRNHRDAIDVFAPEGSAVHAAEGGVVVLADGGWAPGDPFAVSSLRGGNSVVIFDSARNRFFRYCHLDRVAVAPGDLVRAGWLIGTVGHTGANAEISGHGQHLHFEVNQYDGHDVRSLDSRQLLALLRTASPPAVEEGHAVTAAVATVLPIL